MSPPICRLASPTPPIPPDSPRKFWKELIRAGRWTNPRAGFTLDVDPVRLGKWLDAFRAMQAAGIRVPVPWGHSYDPRDNAGFVESLELRDNALWALLDLPAPADADRLGKTVSAVSVSVHPDFVDGTGKRWGEVIEHVALTNYPVVTAQTGFIQAADEPAGAITLELTESDSCHDACVRRSGTSASAKAEAHEGKTKEEKQTENLRGLRGERDSARLVQLELSHANREVDDALRAGKFTRPAAEALRQLLGAGIAARYALSAEPPDLTALANALIAATPPGAAVDLAEHTRLVPMPGGAEALTDARAAQLAKENKTLAGL